jgi:hypothetical protein
MFPTRNGIWVLFIPAYIDHGSTSGQSNGASRYVSPRWCCILGGHGGERIMDVVPRGTKLELQLRRGVGQASHTCNNPHVKCTGVY